MASATFWALACRFEAAWNLFCLSRSTIWRFICSSSWRSSASLRRWALSLTGSSVVALKRRVTAPESRWETAGVHGSSLGPPPALRIASGSRMTWPISAAVAPRAPSSVIARALLIEKGEKNRFLPRFSWSRLRYRSQAKSLLALTAALFGETFGSSLSTGTLTSAADTQPASAHQAAKYINDFSVPMAIPLRRRSQTTAGVARRWADGEYSLSV